MWWQTALVCKVSSAAKQYTWSRQRIIIQQIPVSYILIPGSQQKSQLTAHLCEWNRGKTKWQLRQWIICEIVICLSFYMASVKLEKHILAAKKDFCGNSSNGVHFSSSVFKETRKVTVSIPCPQPAVKPSTSFFRDDFSAHCPKSLSGDCGSF